jgi:hypothetical protein
MFQGVLPGESGSISVQKLHKKSRAVLNEAEAAAYGLVRPPLTDCGF